MKEAENSRASRELKKARSKVAQDKAFLTEDDINVDRDYKIVGWNQLTNQDIAHDHQ